MLLAEFEIRHSRAIAPTRRVALGDLFLPTDPLPGFGSILLAGVVAASVNRLDEEERDGLDQLLADVERGAKILQPRLRYRYQSDVHGLERSHHRLVGKGELSALQLLAVAWGYGSAWLAEVVGRPPRLRPVDLTERTLQAQHAVPALAVTVDGRPLVRPNHVLWWT